MTVKLLRGKPFSLCFPKNPAKSILFKEYFLKKHTGFGFQNEMSPGLFLYKYGINFPKLFLTKNVEKKGKAMRMGISIAYPHCVNICGFEMSYDKNTFVITSYPREP